MNTDIVNTLLLDENTLKVLIPEISPAVDPDHITRFISMEQNKGIRPLFGYQFYNEILSQVSGSTLTTANKYLLDNYILMILSLKVFKRTILSSSYQLENTGLKKKFSNSSENSSEKEISNYRQIIQDDIDYFINEMYKFLDANYDEFPTYFSQNDTRQNTNDPNRRKYSFGFNISKI